MSDRCVKTSPFAITSSTLPHSHPPPPPPPCTGSLQTPLCLRSSAGNRSHHSFHLQRASITWPRRLPRVDARLHSSAFTGHLSSRFHRQAAGRARDAGCEGHSRAPAAHATVRISASVLLGEPSLVRAENADGRGVEADMLTSSKQHSFNSALGPQCQRCQKQTFTSL